MLKDKIFYKILFIIFTIFIAVIISSNEARAASKTDISKTTITYTRSHHYTGSAIKPTVTVKYDNKILKNK